MKFTRPAFVAIFLVYAFIGLSFAYVVHQHVRAQASQRLIETLQEARDPVALYVPSLNIRSEVKPGLYDVQQQTWNVSDDFPHFALVSQKPNSVQGTTVIYAHNAPHLFKELSNLKSNDIVLLENTEGTMFKYAYETTENVEPTDVSIFTESGAPKLVLLTCDGPDNSERKLVHLTFVETL